MDKEQKLKTMSVEEIEVTQNKGTEAPYHNKYWDHHEGGDYLCKVCGVKLFNSDAKFDSGTGWPSFDKPTENNAVLFQEDTTHGMSRVEAICKNCGAHLGHVFNDGPSETGKRFCINSASLDFEKENSMKKIGSGWTYDVYECGENKVLKRKKSFWNRAFRIITSDPRELFTINKTIKKLDIR